MTTSEQKPIVWDIGADALKVALAPSDRFVFSYYFQPIMVKPLSADTDPQSVDVLHELLKSEIGYLFLDRTRIRPIGFAIGELIESLSLAPGEEVVVEQRTFSKRETTFEEQTEQERQMDLELSSTLSTELTEGLDREKSKNTQTSAQTGASVGGNIKGVDVRADASYSQSITEAASQAQKRSVKDSQTSTTKVASKYRSMHKTTFRISTESRFEAGSKRVIKNPNPYTAVDLLYFKILRQVKVTQERFGVRLCWAVSVKDPARQLVDRIENNKNAIIDSALRKVQLPPWPGDAPVLPDTPPLLKESEAIEATYLWDGGVDAPFNLEIAIPDGYKWNDKVTEVMELTKVEGRPRWLALGGPVPNGFMDWRIVGTPWVDSGNLVVRIHVIAGTWFLGPKIFIQTGAKFIPLPADQDTDYKTKYEEWQRKVTDWKKDCAAALEEPRKEAQKEADAWAAAYMDSVDPAVELMDTIVKEKFLTETSGGVAAKPKSVVPWEIKFWGNVFEWERAGVALYPSWWSEREPRDYLQDPTAFINASMATLYLPVRAGFEKLALRWINGRGREETSDPELEAAFKRIVDELTTFRQKSFGDPTEGGTAQEVFTLGTWDELLPTDGTHMEVVQAMTSAIDANTRAQIEASAKAAGVQLQEGEQDVALKKKAVEHTVDVKPEQLNYSISIATGDDDRS